MKMSVLRHLPCHQSPALALALASLHCQQAISFPRDADAEHEFTICRKHMSSSPSSMSSELSAIPLSSSGRESPPRPYFTPTSVHNYDSMAGLAWHRLPTPPSPRSSREDARAYLSQRSSAASVYERDLMSAAKNVPHDPHAAEFLSGISGNGMQQYALEGSHPDGTLFVR